MKYRRFTRIFIALLAFPLSCIANTELNKILSPFKQLSFIHFSYTEIHTSLFFKSAQISSGEIKFTKPDLVIKQVLRPELKKYEINKQQLIISHSNSALNGNKNKISQVNIIDYPQLKQFIDLIRALFSANTKFLQDYYAITINKERVQDQKQERFQESEQEKPTAKEIMNSWILTLIPITDFDNSEQKSIQSIIIKGNHKQIISIKILGFAGDSSEIKIDKILN